MNKTIFLALVLAPFVAGAVLVSPVMPANSTLAVGSVVLVSPAMLNTSIQLVGVSQFQNQSMITLIEQLYQYDQNGTERMLANTLETEQKDIQNAVTSVDRAFYNQSLECGYAVHPFSLSIEKIGGYSFENQTFQQELGDAVQFNLYAQNLSGELKQELQSSSEQVLAHSSNPANCMQLLLALNTSLELQKENIQVEYENQKEVVWGYISNETRQITAYYLVKINKLHPVDEYAINQRLDFILSQQDAVKAGEFMEKLKLLLKSLEYERISMSFNSTNQTITIDNDTNETAVLNGTTLKINGFQARFYNSTLVGVVGVDIETTRNVSGFYFNMTRENETNVTGFESLAKEKNLALSEPLIIIQIDQNLSDENIRNAVFSINFSKESLEGRAISVNNLEVFRDHNGSVEIINYSIQDNGDYYTLTFNSTGLSVFAAYMVNTLTTSSNGQNQNIVNPQNGGVAIGAGFWTMATIIALGGIGAAYLLTVKRTGKTNKMKRK